MSAFHLAQVNVGRLLAPFDDPRIAEFRDNLERINALAEAQPGFVWRLTDESGAATNTRAFDDERILINASVWESADHLAAFVYRTAHRDIFRRGGEWFEKKTQAVVALWWVAAGHTPSPAECVERLEHLRAHGPTPRAFDLKTRFPAPQPETVS